MERAPDLPRLCRNCSATLTGRYCAACGQEDEMDLTFGASFRAFVGDLLDVDSRLWVTLRLLLTRPGLLAAEYTAGRRQRYLAPARLYLVSSVVFFAAVATSEVELVHISTTERESGQVVVGVDTAGRPEASPPAPGARADAAAGPVRGRFAAAAADPERLNQRFVRALAWVMFILIPVFALLLKGLFRPSGMLYLQHLVFALHFHAFAFLTQTVGFAAVRFVGSTPSTSAVVAVGAPHMANAIYLYLAARRFYGERPGRTLWKLSALGLGYLLAVTVGLIATLGLVVLVSYAGP